MNQQNFSLTTPQKNIWNLQKYYPDTAISNLCGAVFYKEKRREDLLEQAINHVIRTQAGLRLRFSEEQGQPKQTVMEYRYETIPVRDFPTYEEFEAYAASLASASRDLMDRAMYHFEIVRIGELTGVLVLLNHLISDAWTFSLVGKGIDEAYRELEAGQAPDWKSYDYVEYIKAETAYRESARYGKDQDFWQEKYESKPELAQAKYRSLAAESITARRYTRKLDKALALQIGSYCKEMGITEAVLFETILGIYLARINPENRAITIGVPVLNRRNAQEKHMMGMFVSTMPLTVETSGEEKVIDLAKRITKEHGNLFRHQKYPYSEILQDIRKKHDFSGNLYEVMVSYQNAQIDEESYTEWFSNGYCETPFVFHIDNRDKNDTFTVTVDYQTEVFEGEKEISLIVDRLEHILWQLMGNRDILVKEISLVPEGERQKVLKNFNNTAVNYENGKCVHQLFTEQAEKTPEKAALVFENETFSFSQLDQMSDSLAFLLRKEGIGPGEIVAILAIRSWHVIVAMLGILKAGGAYMPISPDYPEDRIEHMLQISKAALVLQYGDERKLSVKTWNLDKIDFSCPKPRVENLSSPTDLCYVIFTSGSTGEPKGISLQHSNVVNYVDNNKYNLVCHELTESGYQRIISVTNIIFDIFVTESLLPLLHGMTVYFANDGQAYQQAKLSLLINQGQVEVMQTTPSKMRSYMKDDENLNYLKQLKCIILGGEALTEDLFEKLRKHTKARIFNAYGPAETTVWSSYKEVVDSRDITIGKPIANTQIYILDKQSQMMPIGIPGELCIAGDGVGKGYLNQPELTAERFVPNPFATEQSGHGSVMYRTGDLACWKENGEIRYLGRMDTQVKVRGLRIELGEIENVMSSFPGIIMTAVAKQEQHNRQYLVGYYTAKGGINEKKLRSLLSFRLPQYMVPNYFIQLDEMPMTASGKIDRKKLPWPVMDLKTEEIREYEAPESETEKIVSAIWQEILHVEPVGKKDDFWELGGDSLLAIEVLNQIEARLQAEISVKDIMENSVLEQLALAVENSRKVRQIASHKEQKYVLLPQQKAIYAACRKNPDGLLYNMPVKIPLPRDIEREKLRESILRVFHHHKLLKSHILEQDNEIYGIYDENMKIRLEEYKNGEEQNFVRPFDLNNGPLVRCGFTEDGVLFDFHHIIIDGESLNILLRDIARIYQNRTLNSQVIAYSDYADYFYKLDTEKHRQYFKELLKCDFEPLQFPEARRKEAGGRSKSYEIPEELFMQAKAFARKNNLSHTMVFLGVYGILLSRYAAKKEILSSIILENRVHTETKNLVGMFVNTLPIYLVIKDTMTEYMEEVKQVLLNLFQFQELPLRDIANAVGMEDKSVINTSFIYQGDEEKTLVLNGRKLKPQMIDTHTAKFDLSLELTPLKQGCRLRMEYDAAKLDENLIDNMADSYIRILTQLSKEQISDVTLLSKEEYNRIIEGFNDTHVDYPREQCIHQLFTRQAQKTPGKIALVFENEQFTYKQLDEMSNSLAHFLRDLGVKRNDILPVITDRGWHAVVTILGILKAGGAYLLIDPNYPKDRIEYMLSEIEAEYALVYRYHKKLKANRIIDLSKLDYKENVAAIENQNSSIDLCYVLFTSGSTGRPKAALINHQNLGNFISNNKKNVYQRELITNCKCVLAVTTFVFDIFIFETFLPLLNGLTVVLSKSIVDAEEIAKLIKEYDIDAFHITPTKLSILLQKKKFQNAMKHIKLLMLGAETLNCAYYQNVSKYTDAVIYNGYGPTEATIGSSFKRIDKRNIEIKEDGDITIGKPIANTQIYILDKDSNPVPIGVPGELCIAGDGVGKGYLNRPELTAERFVPNPFATEKNGHGAIMYRTGDLACWQENGEIRYLGRIDTQVKIRGLRIELGEIESVMNTLEGIRIAAVTDKRDSDGRQYLVGYYVADREIAPKELREHLGRRLPKYMIPNYFVRLGEMPMTPSGKIARRNLPEPNNTVHLIKQAEPGTLIEKKLAEIWKNLLKMNKIGKGDDFFALGGDSLLVISMLNEIEARFHVEISMKDIIENPSLEELSEFIEKANKVKQIASDHQSKYVLVPQQKAIYVACSKNPNELLYNIPSKITLPKEIDRNKLKKSIRQALDYHKILRSHIQVEENEIYGIYDNTEIEFEDCLKGKDESFVRPFELEEGPLVRIGFTEDELLFDVHHIVADGESINILLRDIASIYEGKTVQKNEWEYPDYANYFYQQDNTEGKSFFRELLQCDFEPVSLPEPLNKGKGGKSKIYVIPEEIFSQTKDFARKNGLTDTMVFLGAYGILLAKYTGKEEVLSSIILQNRIHIETRNVVGMFVNTLPVFFRVKGSMSDYMSEIKGLMLNLFRFQELPFWNIAKEVGMEDKTVLNTSFIYQSGGQKNLVLDRENLVPQFIDTHTAKFDLSVELTPLKQGCRLRMEYDTAKVDENLIDNMADSYIRILTQLSKEQISDVTLLSKEEYNRIIEGFNDTHVDYPREQCIHQLFTRQAQKTPDKIALVFENEQFTYKQLDQMANSLAHFLRKKGVAPNDIVPIIAIRSWHIIVAMLGVLKAGGAYMPVSPDYPLDRITYMAEIAESKIALMYGCEKEMVIETIDLKNFNFMSHKLEVENVNSSGDTAYVIFTSGSTGTPKGIAVSHGNIHNYLDKNNYNICRKALSNNCKSIVSVTNIVFDIFVTESILPLLAGICIYLANDTEAVSQKELSRLFIKNRIDALQTTPAKMKSFISDKENVAYLEKIKVMILGGEVFQKELYYQLKKYTSAALYNIYGPAETTVWSSIAKVTNEEITIGKPIANTQIYILDKDNNPVSIGVPGELCIAGDGVGKGYLNRPELTAERFVPNPFATEKNGHGAIMYRTGDLACWQENGEIRYLGRIDTQVKIRGLRIELGEIESVMNTLEGIRIAAVTDKRDSDGRQYLVGYYVADREIAPKELREHLGRRLPKYMIPNYFVRLGEMPMTPSGKIARRNLPEPDFTYETADYKAPATETERKLSQVMEQVLGMEQISVEDDFFELGGDSLKAIELVAKARQEGMEIALQQVFDYPTVRQLCQTMEQGKKNISLYEASDFYRYRPLLENNIIDENAIIKERSLGNILLTGATGFLGAHILDELLKDETGIICCLLRGSQEETGEERLRKRLNYYFGDTYDREFGKRIITVSGDLEQDSFSQKIPIEINTVIHSAASVKHYGSYEYFYRANVLLTKHGVEFARKHGARFIHISTLSVSGNTMADDFSGYRSEKEIEFDETTFFMEQPLDNVYIRSKFEAEMAVLDAMLEGMEAKIIRVGNLTNRISDFKFQPNYRENAFLTRIKAVLEFGLFPDYLLPLYTEFSPVDLTARGVVLIARKESKPCVFHLNSDQVVYFDRMMEMLKELGIPMKVVSGPSFNRELQKTMKDGHTEYIYEALQNHLDHDGNLVYDSNIHIKNDFTLWFLKQAGFQWDKIDREYLKGYLEYFRNLGYLEVENEK